MDMLFEVERQRTGPFERQAGLAAMEAILIDQLSASRTVCDQPDTVDSEILASG